MIEILVALALLKMEPTVATNEPEVGEKLQELSNYSNADDRHLELPPIFKQNAKDAPEKLISVIDYINSAASDNFVEDEERKQHVSPFIKAEPDYPKWHWFQRHQTWLSVDHRVLQTRGKNALFQDWSPFE